MSLWQKQNKKLLLARSESQFTHSEGRPRTRRASERDPTSTSTGAKITSENDSTTRPHSLAETLVRKDCLAIVR